MDTYPCNFGSIFGHSEFAIRALFTIRSYRLPKHIDLPPLLFFRFNRTYYVQSTEGT